MPNLFQTGNSEPSTKSIVCLELPDVGWFKAAFIKAISDMAYENNWTLQGDATITYARDKAAEMLESVAFDVIIPQIPIGSIMMWHGDTIPDKWILLQGGGGISKITYPELFEIYGYTFGGGGNIFVLPTMAGYSPYGAGADVANMATGGSPNASLSIANLPAHNHPIIDPGHNHQGSNGGNFLMNGGTGTKNHQPFAGSIGRAEPDTSTKETGITTDNTGSGAGFPILHPVRACKFIIYAGH